jgi:PAS domain S-box-containing protein
VVEEARRYAESIVETVREPLLVLDADLKIISANRNFYRTFIVTPGDTIGSFIYDLGNKQWDIPKLRELLETILPEKATFDNYEVEHDFATIGRRTMLLNARQIERVLGKERIILLAIEDITERKEIEAGLEKTRKELAVIKIAADEVSEYAESVINTVREPLIALDQDLRVVSVSRSFYDFFKVNPEDTVGQLIYDLGNKQWDIPKLRELLETILPQKATFDNYEVEHDFATIGRRTMLLNARQIERVLGKERIILLAIEDITEHKRLEDILAESEGRYRHVFETASDGIVLFEKREGKITHANQAVEKMLGYSLEESVGKKLQDIGIVDIDDFQTLMQILNEIGITNYTDVLIKTKSGQNIDTDIYLADRARLVQCNIRDVAPRKQAEEELKQSEKRYRSIFENAQEGIFRSIPGGKIIMANQAMAKMFGYESPEEGMTSITDIARQHYVNPEDRRILKEMIEEHGFVKGYEAQNYRKDGIIIWTSLTMHAVRDEKGQIVYYDGITEDITNRKQAVERIKKVLGATVQAIAVTVETRDPYTAGHQRRVADLARAIAMEMNLSVDQIDGIRMAAAIHDLGKISVPAEILSKPTKLTNIEFSLIKTHSQSGYDILKDIDFPWPVARTVLEHHERMNGSGYPNGLTGDNILMESRILSVADVMEAMASHRPYRPGLGLDAALKEIEKNKGTLYDNSVADVCLRLFREKGYQLEGI